MNPAKKQVVGHASFGESALSAQPSGYGTPAWERCVEAAAPGPLPDHRPNTAGATPTVFARRFSWAYF